MIEMQKGSCRNAAWLFVAAVCIGFGGEHAKLWGVQAAAAGWSRSTSGRKPRCQWRNASSRVALRT